MVCAVAAPSKVARMSDGAMVLEIVGERVTGGDWKRRGGGKSGMDTKCLGGSYGNLCFRYVAHKGAGRLKN